MAKLITKEQMAEQESYIMKLKEENMRYAAQNGHAKLALTETYGCQQNENDTERIRGMLRQAGFDFTDDSNKADVVIYNTCAVRENAEQKVFGRLGILKHIKEERKDMVIGVCGCMVQQEHITEKIKKVHEHVDLVFGTHALYKMPELLYRAIHEKKTVVDIDSSDGAIAEDIPIMRDDDKKAWVSVMYGCNNFCSYCIVPYVRGRERSRTPEAVIAEVKELVARGCSEIALLGQNVNSYGKDLDTDVDFADLIRMVNDIEGVERIRFMTSHPKDLSDKLIDAIAECDKVCKQLHLPVQAGSNKILKEMNRKYTKEDYLIICGDTGICGYSETEETKVRHILRNLPVTTLFIDGNHEDFKKLNPFPVKKWHGGNVHFIEKDIIHLMRGQIFNLGGITFFTFGGAYSPDRAYREEGISWFPEELPSRQEYLEGWENLKKSGFKVDYILTHTAPQNIISKMGYKDLPDHNEEAPLREFLQQIPDLTDFKAWYFGHFHKDCKIADSFFCLYDILSLIQR